MYTAARMVRRCSVGLAFCVGLVLLRFPAAHSADLLARIKQHGEITVATEARLAPFEFVKNGKIVGYDPDLFALVMKGLPGVKVKELDLPWQGILPGLEVKKFDYVLTAVTATKQRVARYALSLPVSLASLALLKRAGDTSINKNADIVGKVVGSQAGSAPFQQLEALNKELIRETGKGATLKSYVAFPEAYADLADGRIAAVSQSIPNGLYLMKTRPGIFAMVKPGFGPKKYFCWAGRKDSDSASLEAFINARLAELNKSGQMAALQQKWFGYTMEIPWDQLPPPQN